MVRPEIDGVWGEQPAWSEIQELMIASKGSVS